MISYDGYRSAASVIPRDAPLRTIWTTPVPVSQAMAVGLELYD
jgi:hypothetical protein